MQAIVLSGLIIVFISGKTKSDNAYFNTDANAIFDIGSGDGSGLEDFFSDISENDVKVFGTKPSTVGADEFSRKKVRVDTNELEKMFKDRTARKDEQGASRYLSRIPSGWIPPAISVPAKFDDVSRSSEYHVPFSSPQPGVCKLGRVPWILQVRDSDYGWKQNTHRAMIALSVNDYRGDEIEMKNMELQLELELTKDIFRNKTHSMDDSDLTLYIHSLLAINKNPRNFYGVDLVADLLHRVENSTREVNPFLVLALCNSHVVKNQHLLKIVDVVNQYETDYLEADSKTHVSGFQAFALKALACYTRIDNRLNSYMYEMEKIANYLRRKYNKENGTFGNIYSTSSAVQALSAVPSPPSWWDKSKSLEYLERESEIDVNFIKAYYIEMALNAQKYNFIRDLYKGPPLEPYKEKAKEDAHYIQYTVKPSLNPDIYFTVTMNVENGANFYDVMKIASNVSAAFNFTAYENNNGDPMVYSVSGMLNDIEENMFWRLCRHTVVEHGDRHTSGIESYDSSLMNAMPKKQDHYIYEYSNRECR